MDTDLFKDHKYTWEMRVASNAEEHVWSFRARHGGLHLKAIIHPSNYTDVYIGFHSKSPIHNELEPAHHLDCWVTGTECWHDGFSAYAESHYWPSIEAHLKVGDHARIFSVLEGVYLIHSPEAKKEG